MGCLAQWGFSPLAAEKNGERGDFKNRSYVDKKSPHTAVSCGLLQSGGIFADVFSKSLKNPQKGLNTAAQSSSLCARGVERGLEAGGFEPPSRDISSPASTCLVVCFGLAQAPAKRRAGALASSLCSRSQAANKAIKPAR